MFCNISFGCSELIFFITSRILAMFQIFKIAEFQTAEVLNDYIKIYTNTHAFLITVIIFQGKFKKYKPYEK